MFYFCKSIKEICCLSGSNYPLADITRSQKGGISHMIISIAPPPKKSCFKCIKHIQKLYTVINDTETV